MCRPAIPARSPALVDGSSLAYLIPRRLTPEGSAGRWELGAAAYGPVGSELAERLCDQIRAWDNAREQQPVITARPANAVATGHAVDHSIRKRVTGLTVAY